MASEKSPGGSSIHRYDALDDGFRPPAPTRETVSEIEAHVSRHLGEPKTVFHEIVSELVHLDVHLIAPHEGRDCWTLVTTGMSDLPMAVPSGEADKQFAELMISLPRDWKIELLDVTPPPDELERWYWPIRWLKTLARFPHEYQTWLGTGHSMPNGDPPQRIENTRFCGFVLGRPITVPEEVTKIALSDGRMVNLYAVYPLHLEEMNLKLNRGSDALWEAFKENRVTEVVDPRRPPVVRRKLFGLF